MSFVVAQRYNDLVYFLTDSFSEIPLTNERSDWFLEPTTKVVNIRNEWIVAFAGSTYTALHALNYLVDNPKLDPLDVLLSAHRKHPASSDAYVEFAVCRIRELSLIFLKDGKQTTTRASFLGSQSGMEIFQSKKGQPQSNPGTYISITDASISEHISATSHDALSQSLAAFRQSLFETDQSFGGIVVPYVVCASTHGYLMYGEVSRGPVEPYEFGLTGAAAVSFDDVHKGGYQILFSGGENSFSVHYPNGKCGCIYKGFEIERILEAKAYRGIDAYDFTYLTKQAGVRNGFVTWRSFMNDIRKAHDLIRKKEFDRAELLIDEISQKFADKINGLNPESEFDFSKGILLGMSDVPSVIVTIEIINTVTELIKLKGILANKVGKGEEEQELHREFTTWTEILEKARISITLNVPNSKLP